MNAARPARREPPPRLALSVPEAAASIGVSRDSFDKYVLPDVRVIRRGRLVLVPVRELERWLRREAALTIQQTGPG